MNTRSKKDKIKELWNDLALDTSYKNINAKRKGEITNLGLVNQFKKHDFIPNKWFDWESKVNAPVMIIGQDWGPYVELKKFIDDYESKKDDADFDYQEFLFATFSSRTEKFIMRAIEETYQEVGKTALELSDYFFYSVAVLFTRTGIHFRGNHNFDPIRSAEHSYKYLARQIDILSPKIIMPLGGLALDQIEKYFDLNLEGNSLTEKIDNLNTGVIIQKETIIIPNYHPAAHINPQTMLEKWKLIWEYLN